jgi:hypothetical protein
MAKFCIVQIWTTLRYYHQWLSREILLDTPFLGHEIKISICWLIETLNFIYIILVLISYDADMVDYK